MKTTIISLIAAALAVPATAGNVPPSLLESCNVKWDSPSADAKGSMPIGNGDIGLNVWVEPSGDLCFFIGKTDSWDENQRLLKVGKVRVKFEPALVVTDGFSQSLSLQDGSIHINGGGKDPLRLHLWVDANHPVIQVDAKSAGGRPVSATASFEVWRTRKRPLAPGAHGMGESHGTDINMTVPFSWPDTVLAPKLDQIGWYHRNVESPWLASLKLQKNEAIAATGKDPILNRTSGAILRGDNFRSISPTQLKSTSPSAGFSLRVHVLTRITDTADAWLSDLAKQADAVEKIPVTSRWTAHTAWWQEYWNRSWIVVEESKTAPLPINNHPWRLGMDSTGASRFGGEIAGAQVVGRALAAGEIAALAAAPRPATGTTIEGADTKLTSACTLSAWIKPAAGEAGRILDKCTAGRPDGLTLDAYPGLSLRWIAGERVSVAANCLKPGEWQHVAATIDADGRQTIFLNGKPIQQNTDPTPSPAQSLTRAYTLQRFMNACAGRGAYPIKFNGSIFVVDNKFDADFRLWGGCYWFQNTRHSYWPLLTSGDFDLMKPFFDLYMDVLPARKLATKNYYGHDGAFFPETMSIWGNYTDHGSLGYGKDRTGKPDGQTDNTFVRRYWQGGLEIMVMMLDYHDITRDAAFRDRTLLPFAREVITFFDQHWKRGPDGKILFDPAQSLETWHVARNPLPEIAGLRYVIPRLLALPTAEADKAVWRKTLADLPAIPTKTDAKGTIRLSPAETFSNKANFENPELYAIFPYRLYTLTADKDLLAIGKSSYEVRGHRDNYCWRQDPIQTALLGLGDESARLVAARASSVEPGFRFPAMWAAGSDWMPDQDHVGVMMTALQRMLVQYEGDRILLLPAWPKEWNANFKLHAPQNTTVEGRVENGEIRDLKVTPESRRKDVEIRAAQ